MRRREYDVVLVPEAGGGFSVLVPELPSVATQGETVEEALAMARDAIEGYVEVMRESGWPVLSGPATSANLSAGSWHP